MELMNFEKLALETIALSEVISKGRSFHFPDPDPDQDLGSSWGEQCKKQSAYPDSCGLIFKIHKGISTFSFRGIPTPCISDTFEKLKAQDSKLWKDLKVQDNKKIEDLCYFETLSYELAEIVRDQLFNKRFLYHEDLLGVLNDSGTSWWLEGMDNEIKLHFTNPGINDSSIVNLGPMGDRMIACLRFNQARAMFHTSGEKTKFLCNEKILHIRTDSDNVDTDNQLKEFYRLLIAGDNSFSIDSFQNTPVAQTLYYFFQEIAAVRKFWLQYAQEGLR